jgi:6-phosphofructokinase 2
MKRIATLTVNPTIDINTRVDQVVPEKKLRCERPRREPGGGGLNVSRAIQRLGGKSIALFIAGGPTGQMLDELLREAELDRQLISIDDWTRENLIVYEEHSEQQFRFGMPGPDMSEEEWQQCLDEVKALDSAPDYIVASGSLAPGMPDDFYGRLATIASGQDARLIVDTSGDALREAVEAGVYLIKPNVAEFQDLIGRELSDEQQQEEAGRDLIARGCCQVIVVSLGSGGALVITGDGCRYQRTPTVPIRSKVGAGDSMVAGVVLGLARALDLMDAVRFGVAAGAAAVMTPGTELCRREDAERLFEGMSET